MMVSASSASAGSTLEATLTLSDALPDAEDVIYSWDLQVNSPLVASALKVSVPLGTDGEPRLYLVDGLPSGDLHFDGRNIAFEFDETRFSSGQRVIFAVAGLSNGSSEGEFASSVVMGDHAADTPPVFLDGQSGTKAMVFVTSQAAQLSREDPSPSGISAPVLMTNEQKTVYAAQTHSGPWVPTQTWLITALLASLLLVARKRVICV